MDYSEHIIAARLALKQLEDAALSGSNADAAIAARALVVAATMLTHEFPDEAAHA